MKIFAERLKEARLGQGLTQKQLAERVGIARQAIYRQEEGKQIPEVTTLVALAQELNRSMDWFCGLE
ncbi:hypothetical protein CIG66_07075 [Ralstonia pseudosolanacearum]|uniref:helix-turn-helix domain-containing protein n=1 Tax=Ralstonia pseudosolanacearum TaxID=1310165 RepID=UPI000B99FFEC|nr:hypothetical protein CIG66_07075 [Ralstonia pseudosolanacearum]